MNLQEVVWCGMDWIDSGQDRVRWQAFVKSLINFGIP
jgi:hypothetical protein